MYNGLTLNPKAKKAWIEALGTHKQTQGALVENDAYCCLGVFAKINGAKHAQDYDEEGFIFSKKGIKSDGFLPDRWFSKFFKFNKSKYVPATKIEAVASLQSELSNQNDTRGNTFAEIAQWVKNNL